jgi:hypothetical protein
MEEEKGIISYIHRVSVYVHILNHDSSFNIQCLYYGRFFAKLHSASVGGGKLQDGLFKKITVKR